MLKDFVNGIIGLNGYALIFLDATIGHSLAQNAR